MRLNGIKTEEESAWLNLSALSEVSSWTHQRDLQKHKNVLRRIFEEEEHEMNDGRSAPARIGVDYVDSASDVVVKRCTALAENLRKAHVDRVLKKMKAARKLDLCFLVDVTGNMQPYITEVKDSIRSIVEKLTAKPSVEIQPIVNKV